MNLEAELAKLDALETVEDSQYQFQTPFRAILFGTLVRENIIFFSKADVQKRRRRCRHSFVEFRFFFIFKGPSGSGKTNWITKVLKERQRLFNPVPTKILWFYQRYFRDVHEILKNEIPEIQFFDSFDYEYTITKIEESPEERHLLILDDCLQSPVELELIFTRYVRSFVRSFVLSFVFSFQFDVSRLVFPHFTSFFVFFSAGTATIWAFRFCASVKNFSPKRRRFLPER